MNYIYAKTEEITTETPFQTIKETIITQLSLEPKNGWTKIELLNIKQITEEKYSYRFKTKNGDIEISDLGLVSLENPIGYETKIIIKETTNK
jgi:hypothetical protein